MAVGRPTGARSFRQSLLSIAVVIFCMAVALFLPAGRIEWARGWLFLTAFTVAMALTAAYLRRTNPEILVARSKVQPGTKPWDKALFFLLNSLILAIFLVASLDDGRYHWSAVPLWLTGAGYVLWCIGTATIAWAMSVNKFAEMTVRIQTERGHKVVDSGPYAIVRHPFYVGMFFWLAGAALALGSFWALAPAGLTSVLLILRTALEDRALRRELEGYKEYAARVRFRLISGIW